MNSQNPLSKSIELLAPVGSFAAFEAALTEGADAVYLGAPDLNARALARDFTFSEIGAMIQYAHRQEVKVYIAMNSLVKEAELPMALDSLAHFAALKADALIIQDIGLLHLAGMSFPDLQLHASTLMSVHNSSAVKEFVGLGCKRVVLPRELTIEEIGTIFRKTGAELEVFVHGAMCFSYSGLCLFSSLHGGKSSLRGKCVQPCRRQYSWQKKKRSKGNRHVTGKGGDSLFSMNDLSAIELLPELARAGVKSLKIEGRLKSAEYVRKTVRAYRLMLDNLDKTGTDRQKKLNEARKLLDEAMGRRRSTGFFLGRQPQEAITPHFSGNVGMMVGKVHGVETKYVPKGRQTTVMNVSLRHPVRVGDRLRLHNEKTGERTSFTLRTLWVGQHTVQEGKAGQKVRIVTPQKFPGKPVKKFQGSLFRVDIGSGRQDEKSAREKILRQARKTVALDRERINSVMKSINAGPVKSGDISSPNNDTRTLAAGHPGGQVQWWIKVNAFRDMHFRLPMVPGKYVVPVTEENVEQGLKLFKKYYGTVIWSFPPVILDDRLDCYFRAAAALMQKQYSQFQIGHISHLSLFPATSKNQPPLKIYGDYTVNTLNSLSLRKMRQMGLAGTLFSIETDRENLAEALSSFRQHRQNFVVGMYAFGRPPLFTARLDDLRFDYGKRFLSPRGEEYILSRANEMTLAKSVEPFSLLGEWKNLARMDVDYLLVDLSAGNMKRNVSELIGFYNKKSEFSPSMSGNFFEVLA